MFFSKLNFKLVRKVFTTLRKRLDTDGEETSRRKANSLAGYDYSESDITRTHSGPLTLGSTPTPRRDGPQSETSSGFCSTMGTSSADDSTDVHQRYELEAPCSE